MAIRPIAAQRLCRVVENASPSLDLTALAHPCTDAVSGETNTSNVETRYEYDAAGNMTAQYTPNGTGGVSVTTFAYDALARITATTDPDGNVEGANRAAHTTSWTYDAAGNQASQIDPDGSRTYWFYDAAARLCRRVSVASGAGYTLPAHPCTDTGGVSGAAVDTIYTNDAAGNMTSATNALSGEAISATYDALARPMAVSHSGGAIADPGTTYSYGIHNLGRTDPSGAYSFGLDAAGRQASLIDPLHTIGNAYGWSYEASGQLYSVTDPTGNVTAYAHDPLGRVVNISVSGASGCAVCVLLSYSYNAASSQIGTESTISGDPANGSIAYGYDPLGRLASYAPGASGIEHQAYGWAALPDRTSITRGTADPIATAYDAASRPVSDASHASDAQGRITKTPGSHPGEVLSLSWDPLGRLTSVSSSLGSSTSYRYDPLDRLETTSSGGTTTSFLYVGLTDAVASVSVTASGTTVTTKHVTDLAGTELFEWVSGSDPVYLGRNLHNDVVWTYGPSGAPASHATYDPFGNIAASTGTVPATRWQSSWQDTGTGLYYVIARWYDPVSGAFLSTDPLDGVMSDPQSLDRYAYGAGDPVGALDTSGQCGYDANTHTFSGTNCPTPPVTKPLPRQAPTPRRTNDSGRDSSYGVSRIPAPASIQLPPMILDTSVVGLFHEPDAYYGGNYNHDNWELCGAGALRVVLAFASSPSIWSTTTLASDDGPGDRRTVPYWPTTQYKDLHSGQLTQPDPGGADLYGQAYLLYLAYGVTGSWLSTQYHTGVVGLHWDARHKVWTDYGANGWDVVAVANYEYSGHKTTAGPFSLVYSGNSSSWSLAAFDRDIQIQLSFYGVPVAVAAHTLSQPTDTCRQNPSIHMPSWTASLGCWGGHFIEVVGFDRNYFYYVDTCAKGKFNGTTVNCRIGPRDDDSENGRYAYHYASAPFGVRAHVWQVAKADLWQLISEWSGTGWYMKYSGGLRAHAPY